MTDTEKTGEESGAYPILREMPCINPETTPYMPEITRMAFRNVGKQMERMRTFFADVFYFQTGRNPEAVKLADKAQQALLSGGMSSDECFVGHVRSPAEGIDDELVLSTRRALVLFDCEPQAFTREHPAPLHAALKFVDPREGLYIQPHSGLFTLNFGGLRFHEDGVYEKRHGAEPLNGLEAELWKAHVSRWGRGPNEPTPADIQKSSLGSILGLLNFKRRTGETPPDIALPVPVSYPEFQRRLQDIMYTMGAGLKAINGFIDGQRRDAHLHPEGFDRY